jgi:Flp pilus assembly protein TadB
MGKCRLCGSEYHNARTCTSKPSASHAAALKAALKERERSRKERQRNNETKQQRAERNLTKKQRRKEKKERRETQAASTGPGHAVALATIAGSLVQLAAASTGPGPAVALATIAGSLVQLAAPLPPLPVQPTEVHYLKLASKKLRR